MKFNTVIIGGGLAGLTAGISLLEKGLGVAIISQGHSALHFNSGSFGLLGFDKSHKPTEAPFTALAGLDDSHPYVKIGENSIAGLAEEAKKILADSGLRFNGDSSHNHSRISPMGIARPAWLTLDGMLTLEALEGLKPGKIAIVGIDGFLDFYPRFIAAALEKIGYECADKSVTTERLKRLRKNETEMRAHNIARVISGEGVSELIAEINKAAADCDLVIFPSVAGSENPADYQRLRDKVRKPLLYCSTVGLSVPGIMIANALTRRFIKLGGTLLKGDSVTSGNISKDHLDSVRAKNLSSDIEADNFILAGGSFFSHALEVKPDRIIEPVFGLEVSYNGDRNSLFSPDMFAHQQYMEAGVRTDNDFKPFKDGQKINNLYAIGSILSGAESVKEDSGAGVAMLTALHTAHSITE